MSPSIAQIHPDDKVIVSGRHGVYGWTCGELFDSILRVASGGERARNEVDDYREIAIWKEGLTL